MILGFSQLLGVWPRRWGRHSFYTEINSRKPSAPGHHDRAVEDTHWEVSAIAPLIAEVLFVCFIFFQGEHSKNFFQKEKVLYTSATETGELYLHLLYFLMLAIFQLLVLQRVKAVCHMC